MFYSSLKASMGFIFIALVAGIIPAKSPATINTASAAIATVKLTVGLLKKTSSPGLVPELAITLFTNSSKPTPIDNPR